MLLTKFRGNRPASSIEDFFTIYGHGGHLGHVTSIILMNFYFNVPKNLTYKIWLKTAQWFLRKACFIFHT